MSEVHPKHKQTQDTWCGSWGRTGPAFLQGTIQWDGCIATVTALQYRVQGGIQTQMSQGAGRGGKFWMFPHLQLRLERLMAIG